MKGDQFGYILKTLFLIVLIYYGAEPFMNYMTQPFEWGQVALIFAILLFSRFVLKEKPSRRIKFDKDIGDHGKFSGRAKSDALRLKIAKSKDMEKQKQMAYEAAQAVYGTSKPLKLNLGDVVGVINGSYYVFKPKNSNELKSVCVKCVKHMLDNSYSHNKLGEHHVSGETIAAGQLSKRDYAGMHLMQIRMGTFRVWYSDTGRGFGQEEEKYTGGPLHCEVNYKCKPIAK